MHRFLINYVPPPPKKRKTEEEKLQQQRQYEQASRVRGYLPKWGNEFSWLKHDPKVGMTCGTCVNFEKHGTFITGCMNYKKDAILSHEKSEGHRNNVLKWNATINPSTTAAAKSIRALNKLTIARLVLKFINAHALCKKGRPYTDYIMQCDLDEAKGLDVGSQYRSDKSAAEFSSSIAEAERVRIRKYLSNAKFMAAISDGSTDSSYQEAEIVYVRSCQSGNVSVNFSIVKNVPKGDAKNISQVILEGVKNLTDTDKLVGFGTDGANVMLGHKTGAVQQIREATNKPWLVGVHCSGHKLELAYKDMVKCKIPLYDKVDSFLLNIYYFYRHSNLNRALLKDSFKAMGQKVILPTRVGGTRWIGHLKKAIECYLQGYKAIIQHLEQVDQCYFNNL